MRFGAFVDGVERFDSSAFRLPYSEAAALDPQARILLEQTQVWPIHVWSGDPRMRPYNVLQRVGQELCTVNARPHPAGADTCAYFKGALRLQHCAVQFTDTAGHYSSSFVYDCTCCRDVSGLLV